jgi:hypothetical protein
VSGDADHSFRADPDHYWVWVRFSQTGSEAKTSSNKAGRGTSMGVGLVDSAAVTSPQCEAKSCLA